MKKTIVTVLSLAALSVAYGQGTFATLSNNIGTTYFPILKPDGSVAAGPTYTVQVFVYDANATGGFGTQIGIDSSPKAPSGRFLGGANVVVPNHGAGTTADLIVRAWDNTSGATYDLATIRGASPKFTSEILGGTPAGGGLPITGKTFVSGLAAGFQGFSLTGVPEPTTIALGALGAAALFIRRRK